VPAAGEAIGSCSPRSNAQWDVSSPGPPSPGRSPSVATHTTDGERRLRRDRRRAAWEPEPPACARPRRRNTRDEEPLRRPPPCRLDLRRGHRPLAHGGPRVRGRIVRREDLLEIATWTHVLTWIFQVMPVFFIVGGFTNAGSWRSASRRGVSYATWLRARSAGLLGPALVFVASWTVLPMLAVLVGLPSGMARTGRREVATAGSAAGGRADRARARRRPDRGAVRGRRSPRSDPCRGRSRTGIAGGTKPTPSDRRQCAIGPIQIPDVRNNAGNTNKIATKNHSRRFVDTTHSSSAMIPRVSGPYSSAR
jgi:hypothetical protein